MKTELITQDKKSLRAEFLKRKKSFIEETIPGPMLDTYLEKGWELIRTNKGGSHRVKKTKPHSDLLEDRSWCILYLLGYEHLNIGRKFTMALSDKENGPTKQIDVFGYDDSTIIVFECKSSAKREKKNMGAVVHEFAGYRKQISDTLRRHFGKDDNRSIIWAMLTNNVVWSDKDLERAEKSNIKVVRDTEIAYYYELGSRIGKAARYQFQAEFLSKSKTLKDVKVYALRTKLAGKPVYNFFAPAKKILPISFVNHRDLRDPDAAPSYQRMVQKNRLKKIGDYLKGGGYFPNSIIVNFHSEVQFDILKPADEDGIAAGILRLPSSYKSLMIIDGQHRLYGYTQLDEHDDGPDLQFLAFEGITVKEETKLFSDINFQQKTVSRSLLDEISGEIQLDSPIPEEKLRAISSRTFDLMRSDLSNPLGDKIAGVDLTGGGSGLLKLPTLNTAVKEAGLLGTVRKSKDGVELVQGPLVWKTPKQAIDRLFRFLTAYFELYEKAATDRWEGGKEGVIARNISVAGLIKLIPDLVEVRRAQTGADPRLMEPEDIVDDFKPLLRPLLKHFKETEITTLTEEFRSKYGQGAPKEFQRKCRFIIHAADPAFMPPGLEDQLREFSSARTEAGDRLTRLIQERLLTTVTKRLKAHYGDTSDYLVDAGMDTKVFGGYTTRQQEHRKKYDETLPVETFVDFIDWKSIVKKSENWQLVGDIVGMNLENAKNPNRNEMTSWFNTMNDIRRIPAHPFGRESYSDDEISFLKRLYEILKAREVITEEVDIDAIS